VQALRRRRAEAESEGRLSWPEAVIIVAGLAAIVGLARICLPYVVKRTDLESRLQALEAANVELKHQTSQHDQVLEYLQGGTRLPRTGVAR
jgi:hypothetical protein